MDENKERRRGDTDVLLAIARMEENFNNSHKAFRAFEIEVKEWNHELRATIQNMAIKVNSLETLGKKVDSHENLDNWRFNAMLALLTIIAGMAGWSIFH